MKTKIVKLMAAIGIIFLSNNSFSQSCGTCTVTISANSGTLSAAAFTVDSGQIFCIDSTGRFTGTITLSGGTICNKGGFKPASFTFNSGTVTNYGSAVITSSVSLGSSKTITVKKNAMLRVSGNLVFSGGNITNQGIINVKNDVTHTSGSLTNSGIVNCKTFTMSTSSFTNTGIINQD